MDIREVCEKKLGNNTLRGLLTKKADCLWVQKNLPCGLAVIPGLHLQLVDADEQRELLVLPENRN